MEHILQLLCRNQLFGMSYILLTRRFVTAIDEPCRFFVQIALKGIKKYLVAVPLYPEVGVKRDNFMNTEFKGLTRKFSPQIRKKYSRYE